MRKAADNVTVEVEVVHDIKEQRIVDTGYIQVVLGRRLLGNFMIIYMPTILLNIIGHSTNYFKHFYFEATVSVNLTVSHDNEKKIYENDICPISGNVSPDYDVCERE